MAASFQGPGGSVRRGGHEFAAAREPRSLPDAGRVPGGPRRPVNDVDAAGFRAQIPRQLTFGPFFETPAAVRVGPGGDDLPPLLERPAGLRRREGSSKGTSPMRASPKRASPKRAPKRAKPRAPKEGRGAGASGGPLSGTPSAWRHLRRNSQTVVSRANRTAREATRSGPKRSSSATSSTCAPTPRRAPSGRERQVPSADAHVPRVAAALRRPPQRRAPSCSSRRACRRASARARARSAGSASSPG